jgi:putative transposase
MVCLQRRVPALKPNPYAGLAGHRSVGGTARCRRPRSWLGLKRIWADGAYTGEKLAGWCKEQGEWELEIVARSRRSADTEGFTVLPHTWIVERTLSWLMRNRRLSKDYERKVQASETFIEVAMIRLILRRLAR